MEKLKEHNCTAAVVTSLDDIAWLTNLRGSDIDYSPLFVSYALIYQDLDKPSLILYRDGELVKKSGLSGIKLNLFGQHKSEMDNYLKENRIQISPYNSIFRDLSNFSAKVAADPQTCNHRVYSTIKEENRVDIPDLVSEIKLIKTEKELDGYRSCQLRDAAALVKFFAWLENELINKGEKITEFEAALKLKEFRKQGELFMGLSFPAIIASGGNGAIVHYNPTKEN
jgi:Xaa-Pro aminopeptidase